MLSDAQLEELCSRGEGHDLEYKAERYPFSKASDEEKSELLKDILAMGNTQRDGTAYILIGFKENPPHPASVVGLMPDATWDDARLQQFVNEKLESKLNFKYEEQMYDGKHVAVISIPKQIRPFFLNKDYGKLAKGVVYVRRGSATGIASAREIYQMGVRDYSKGDALIDVIILNENNLPLEGHFVRNFIEFDELPDFAWESSGFMSPPRFSAANRHYWRQLAEYYVARERLVYVRLTVTNRSQFALSNVKVEVTLNEINGQGFKILTASDLPQYPNEEWGALVAAGDPRIEVDEDGPEPVLIVQIGNLLPDETRRTPEDMVFLPEGPGEFTMKLRVLAGELFPPLIIKWSLSIAGESKRLTIDDLEK